MTGAESAPIRVMIVDDHKAILWGLERLVESAAPRMRAVGSASTCETMLATAMETNPDVIVLDLDLNGTSTIDALPVLKQCCTARVLVLTGDRNPASHKAAILAGARGVVLKDESAEALLQAIERVYAGEFRIDSGLMDRVLGLLSQPPKPEPVKVVDDKAAMLTTREREIIRAVVRNRGAKSTVLAETLNISEHTLRNHLTVIYGKLGVDNRLDLFVYATEHNLAAD